jgi:phosphoglycolate phosphatase
MPIKAILFDFDLTLADASEGIYQCMNHALNAFNYPPAGFEAVKKTIGHTLPDSFRILTGNTDAKTAESFVKVYVAHADKVMNENTFIFPPVLDVLQALSEKNLDTAIVSTKYRYRIDAVLKRDNLSPYVGCVIGGEDVKNHKPDPEGILLAIEKLGIARDEALYIGDSTIDAEAARNAAVEFCGVLTGTTGIDEFKQLNVKHIIPDLSGLIGILGILDDHRVQSL